MAPEDEHTEDEESQRPKHRLNAFTPREDQPFRSRPAHEVTVGENRAKENHHFSAEPEEAGTFDDDVTRDKGAAIE